MQRPSLLGDQDPTDALCHHFNVQPTRFAGSALPSFFDMPITQDAHMPTHVLAVMQADASPTSMPLMLPIDYGLYEQGFRTQLSVSPPQPGSVSPIPHISEKSGLLVVSLPVIPITVPHTASFPLLLLFGLGLETQPNLMGWRLLPGQVIGEFPNAAAMAQNLSRISDDRFEAYLRFNHGLWKNILALGLQNITILELVQTVWNVTAEARRIRQRGQHR